MKWRCWESPKVVAIFTLVEIISLWYYDGYCWALPVKTWMYTVWDIYLFRAGEKTTWPIGISTVNKRRWKNQLVEWQADISPPHFKYRYFKRINAVSFIFSRLMPNSICNNIMLKLFPFRILHSYFIVYIICVKFGKFY